MSTFGEELMWREPLGSSAWRTLIAAESEMTRVVRKASSAVTARRLYGAFIPPKKPASTRSRPPDGSRLPGVRFATKSSTRPHALRENVFQVRLARSGSIEFHYGDVAEKDGIVGLFCGAARGGKLIDSVDLPPSRLDTALDVRHAELQDDGAGLRLL